MPTPIDTQGAVAAPRPAAKKPVKKPVRKAPAVPNSGYLSIPQIEALAIHAGASQDEAATLAAIAMAESGGKVNSLNDNQSTGDLSYGLWQINMLGQMGPNRLQQFGLHSNEDLYNPLTNARAAVALLRANGGYSDWSTYKSGAYQGFVGQAQQALPQAAKVDVTRIKPVAGPTASATYTGADVGQAGTPKSLTVKQYLDNPDIAAKYGFLAAYLKDPAIGPVLAAAAKGNWGENEILGALTDPKAGFPKAVQWWKKTSTTAALWQAQQNLEPGTAKERLGNMTGQVQQLAESTLGQQLDPARAGQIANTAIAHGWSQAQLQSAVGAEFHYNASQTAYGGLAGQTLDSLRQHASDYLVPLSDQTLNQWTQGVLKGTFKDTDFNDYLKSQAESLYPTLKTALDSGVTTKQFLNPYAQMVQQTLGKNPDDINWMDPRWAKALNTTTPDGQRAPMSLSDWGSYLRSTTDYQYTDQAKQNASDLALNVVQRLGKVAP